MMMRMMMMIIIIIIIILFFYDDDDDEPPQVTPNDIFLGAVLVGDGNKSRTACYINSPVIQFMDQLLHQLTW